jgi:hypothetical protein
MIMLGEILEKRKLSRITPVSLTRDLLAYETVIDYWMYFIFQIYFYFIGSPENKLEVASVSGSKKALVPL